MTNLETLLRRKTVTVLGINTGTSIDGLDLSIVRISQKGNSQITPLKHRSVSFPVKLRTELMDIASQPTTSLERFSLLDEALGEFIGRAAVSFIKLCHKHSIKVDFIASHGQTVRHHPQFTKIADISVRSTLQIGSPERIAAATQRLVVSHFRQADTALGGEGAPITTEAVHRSLGTEKQSRLIVNIGGIANFFYLPARKQTEAPLAEDIGPGNLLLDQVTQTLFDKPFDKSGSLAKSGVVHQRLLKKLLEGNYFIGNHTHKNQSTGREQYGAEAIKKILKCAKTLRVDNNSILTTLTELTALKIYQRLAPLLSADKSLQGIYLTGGGAKNTFLVRRLRNIFSKTEANDSWNVSSISTLGMNPDSFEATCFAVLGWMCLYGIPTQLTTNTLKTSSTSKRLAKRSYQLSPILGRIVQAPVVK